MSETKLKAVVIGATGYVGQRLLTILADHPYFEVARLVAGQRSAGKSYGEAVKERWKLPEAIPRQYKDMHVYASDELEVYCQGMDLAFCAVDMDKEAIVELEEAVAKEELPVISNNSANRWTPDVPMLIPEINAQHLTVIQHQKQRLGTKRGFIVTKPNCSIQSFLPTLIPLQDLGVEQVVVSTYQAVSGAGRLLADWHEMQGNVIPYIGGEEEKTELEPLKILGRVEGNRIINAESPHISGQCIRVPVQEGHLATVWVSFRKPCEANDILLRWRNFQSEVQEIGLPSAPKPFLRYYEDQDRPQPRLDVDWAGGMGISIGRLREDPVFDYKYVCLSANTLRGAAGGSVLTAELLYRLGYLD
ncbi:MAG: aspartate-semialdehyde dehydrogenase [Eubacteriales bacterium]|nr:aspartate-semialdehyde dehydrogenase [Eubacteriales bacterium]